MPFTDSVFFNNSLSYKQTNLIFCYFSSVSRRTFSISALTRKMRVSESEAEYFFMNEELMFFGQAFLEKRISGSICKNDAISSMTCGGGKETPPSMLFI